MKANPAPQVALLRALSVEIEITLGRITLGRIASRTIIRPPAEAQSVGVSAGGGTEADAQSESVATPGVQLQSV